MTSRLVSREKAAEYCGLTPAGYDKWVRKGIVPKAVPGTTKYDLKALDQRLDQLSGVAIKLADDDADSEADRWLKDNGY